MVCRMVSRSARAWQGWLSSERRFTIGIVDDAANSCSSDCSKTRAPSTAGKPDRTRAMSGVGARGAGADPATVGDGLAVAGSALIAPEADGVAAELHHSDLARVPGPQRRLLEV